MSPKLRAASIALPVLFLATLFRGANAANPRAASTLSVESTRCPGLPPYLPSVAARETNNNVEWLVTMASQFSTYDSIWVDSRVRNHADRRVRFTKKGAVVAELTCDTGSRRLVPISPGAGLRTERVDRTPAPDQAAYDFRADLKAYFGKLEPGAYRVRFHWPADAYATEGLADYTPKDLESEWHAFEVNAIDPDELAKALPPAYQMIARKDPPDPTAAGPLPVGTFTNSNAEVIQILLSSDGPAAKPGQPLRVLLHLVRWERGGAAPVIEWPPRTPTPSESLREVRPGETIELSLPDWECEGDGIYSYKLDLYHKVAGHSEPYFLEQVFSKPFVIGQVTAARPNDNRR